MVRTPKSADKRNQVIAIVEPATRILRDYVEQFGDTDPQKTVLTSVIDAFERYISCNASTLDEAFSPKQIGRPRGYNRLAMATKIHTLRENGVSWVNIGLDLGIDESTAREIYEHHKIEILAAQLAKSLPPLKRG